MMQRIYTYFRDRKHLLWAGAVAAAVVIVILLAVLLPQPGPDGPGPTATPSPTATPAGNTTATATAGDTAPPDGTPAGTATAGPTAPPDGTPAATATSAEDEVSIYFRDAEIEVGAGCQEFTTDILITPDVDFFSACQFRLGWDATLFYISHEGWTLDGEQIDMRGRICTTEACNGPAYRWAASSGVNPTGDGGAGGLNPCPQEYHRNMFYTDYNEEAYAQGCLNGVVDWGVTAGGDGYQIREHSGGTNDNIFLSLIHI